jgi:hypothetical protein
MGVMDYFAKFILPLSALPLSPTCLRKKFDMIRGRFLWSGDEILSCEQEEGVCKKNEGARNFIFGLHEPCTIIKMTLEAFK